MRRFSGVEATKSWGRPVFREETRAIIDENRVDVLWDGEAEVWVAESGGVPGLVA